MQDKPEAGINRLCNHNGGGSMKMSRTFTLDMENVVWLRDQSVKGMLPAMSLVLNDLIAQLREGKIACREQ